MVVAVTAVAVTVEMVISTVAAGSVVITVAVLMSIAEVSKRKAESRGAVKD